MPRVYVSIGSNQNRERNVRAAVAALDQSFAPVALSSVYETQAVGFAGDPFFNLVAGFDTDCSLDEVLVRLHAIETDCGRVRSDKRFGPRTLDIDVLTYGDLVCEDQPVELPRSEITSESYVLEPLAQLAPDALHPKLGRCYRDLWQQMSPRAAPGHRVDFDPRAGAPR